MCVCIVRRRDGHKQKYFPSTHILHTYIIYKGDYQSNLNMHLCYWMCVGCAVRVSGAKTWFMIILFFFADCASFCFMQMSTATAKKPGVGDTSLSVKSDNALACALRKSLKINKFVKFEKGIHKISSYAYNFVLSSITTCMLLYIILGVRKVCKIGQTLHNGSYFTLRGIFTQ